MKAIREFQALGYRFVICGRAFVDGKEVDVNVDVDDGTVVIAGSNSDQRVVNAFAAGMRAATAAGEKGGAR